MKNVVCLLSGIEVAEMPGIPAGEAFELANCLLDAGFEVEVRNEVAKQEKAA